MSPGSEILAHTSPTQRDFILARAAGDLRVSKKPMLIFPNGVSLLDVLRTFASDMREDVEGSLDLGLPHVATRAEIAAMVAARLGLKFNAPTLSLDEVVELERSALIARPTPA